MKKTYSKATRKISDEILVEKIQLGNDKDFNILSQRYKTKLIRYIFNFTKNIESAEDILQNTLIKTHKNINRFDLSKKFSPWIYRIAHNETMTYLNKETKNRKVLSLDNDGQIEDDIFSQKDIESLSMNSWFKKELQDEIQVFIKKLPEKYSSIIYMKFIEDLSYQEISESLNIPINTVRTQVSRAKKQLLKIILSEQIK